VPVRLAPEIKMNDELQLRAKHFAALKSKYKATQYEHSSPSSLLYLILRKADLEIELTDLELDWLRDRQLFDTIDLIWLARRRREEPQRLENDFSHLKSKYQVGKVGDSSLASRLYPLLWKLDSEGTITDAEVKWLQQQGFARTASLAQEMGRFAALKGKYKATGYPESSPDSPLYQILKKLDAGKRLTGADENWLKKYQLFDPLEIFQKQEGARAAEFSQLKSKYQANQHQDSSPASPLYNILQTLEADKPLSESDISWLKKVGLSETIAIAQDMEAKRQFAALKAKYKASQYEDSSPSCHLYKIIARLEDGKQLQESDTNWLKKRKLTETMAIAEEVARFTALKNKYKATQYKDSLPAGNLYQILGRLEAGNQLSHSEINWLQQQGFKETVALAQEMLHFAALKVQYRATSYLDSHPSSPLYQILRKIDRGKLLTDSEVTFLTENQLFTTIALARDIEKMALAREKHCAALKEKYGVSQRTDSPDSRLYTIVQKLEEGERLEEMEVAWLTQEALLHFEIAIAYHTIEANFYEQEFKNTGSQWHLPSASSHWRKAGEPKRALELTDRLQWDTIKENKLKSALFTTRGGAFRDIGDLSEAEKCARQAMAHQPDSHHPYTLMGAICYEREQYSEGDYWFNEAIKRGANPRDMDAEIKRVVKNAKDESKRRKVVEYLLKKDPERYAWAKSYLKKPKAKS
jgi:hypothetical protein